MTSNVTIACRACHHTQDNVPIVVREMLFGTGEPFPYTVCSACGTISINDIPADLHRHYPVDYYSFATPKAVTAPDAPRALVRRLQSSVLLTGLPGTDRLLRGNRTPEWLPWLRGRGVTPRSRVCDIGCGEGSLLQSMRRAGFADLTGADPFVRASSERGGVKIRKATIEDIEDEFDLVMLNHSFEHMPDPHGVLARLRQLLAPGGLVLIRMPVAGTYAWSTYGADWSQLDAPRHLAVYTISAMRAMVASAGLELEDVVFDSNTFLFWGSEQYRRGIPGIRPTADPWTPHEMFTSDHLEEFARRTAQLNAAGDGDQACFYLRST